MVRRVDDPADRRSLRAAITPLGRARQAVGAKKVRQLRRKFGKALGMIDHAALKRGTELLHAGALKPRGEKEDRAPLQISFLRLIEQILRGSP